MFGMYCPCVFVRTTIRGVPNNGMEAKMRAAAFFLNPNPVMLFPCVFEEEPLLPLTLHVHFEGLKAARKPIGTFSTDLRRYDSHFESDITEEVNPNAIAWHDSKTATHSQELFIFS